MKGKIVFSIFAVALAVLFFQIPDSSSFPSYFTSICAGCHSDDVETCAGCHAHGVHSSSSKNDINLTATTDKATYAPGETIMVTINGGYRSGWVRAKLYDENGNEIARSSGPGGTGSGENFPITLTGMAPATVGQYTWSAAWFGNGIDAGGAVFGTTKDSTIVPGHLEEIIPTNTFEVASVVICTDADGDGYSVEGGVCGPVDCNDGDPAVNPGAAENCTDGVDNNCDGLVDSQDPNAQNCPVLCTDADGDGYAVEGGTCGPVDCNDSDPAINPGAAEECTDGIDNNCNNLLDGADPEAVNCTVCTDADGDGYSVEGGTCGPIDCNDADPNVNAGAGNCPVACTDADGDGFAVEGGTCGPVDCNDADPGINPNAAEDCTDGIDNNCNGLVDTSDPNALNCPAGCTDADGDGYSLEGGACGPVDCDDSTPAKNPGNVEICTDGLDNDCNGKIDSSDPACSSAGSDYDIKEFKCGEKVKAGKSMKLKVKIRNRGATDPGAILNVFGMIGSERIPVAEDMLVLEGPGKGEGEFKFRYTPADNREIVWHATLDDGSPDDDEAVCISRARKEKEKDGDKDEDKDDDDRR